jgi:hypothetical protein
MWSYEQWFYVPIPWKTAEAIPVLGKYTTNEALVSKHYDEFHQLGIDWLLIGWSNMLWTKAGSFFTLDVTHMQPGKHKITLTANGVHTYFSLDPEHAVVRSQ